MIYNFIKSKKFNDALYFNGRHYFPQDIKPSTSREGFPFEIQVCYKQGKWHQDTAFITTEFCEAIINCGLISVSNELIIEWNDVQYLAKIERGTQDTSNYNHWISVYKIGENLPIAGTSAKFNTPLREVATKLIEIQTSTQLSKNKAVKNITFHFGGEYIEHNILHLDAVDHWYTFNHNGAEFDVHIYQEDGKREVIIYEYDPKLDTPSHRFALVHKETI